MGKLPLVHTVHLGIIQSFLGVRIPDLGPSLGLPRWFSGKESACQCRRCWFDPWIGKIPWRRRWQPPSLFLPGRSHGQRSLAGYRSWGRKERDLTEYTHTHTHTHTPLAQPRPLPVAVVQASFHHSDSWLHQPCLSPGLPASSCPFLSSFLVIPAQLLVRKLETPSSLSSSRPILRFSVPLGVHLSIL